MCARASSPPNTHTTHAHTHHAHTHTHTSISPPFSLLPGGWIPSSLTLHTGHRGTSFCMARFRHWLQKECSHLLAVGVVNIPPHTGQSIKKKKLQRWAMSNIFNFDGGNSYFHPFVLAHHQAWKWLVSLNSMVVGMGKHSSTHMQQQI